MPAERNDVVQGEEDDPFGEFELDSDFVHDTLAAEAQGQPEDLTVDFQIEVKAGVEASEQPMRPSFETAPPSPGAPVQQQWQQSDQPRPVGVGADSPRSTTPSYGSNPPNPYSREQSFTSQQSYTPQRPQISKENPSNDSSSTKKKRHRFFHD